MNGEWRMANYEWRMVNGEWRITNGEWWITNGEWRLVKYEWRMVNGEWRMENDEWRIANGEWNTTQRTCSRTQGLNASTSLSYNQICLVAIRTEGIMNIWRATLSFFPIKIHEASNLAWLGIDWFVITVIICCLWSCCFSSAMLHSSFALKLSVGTYVYACYFSPQSGFASNDIINE